MSFVFAAIILQLFSPSISEWISHSENRTPREDTMSAIGSYNGSIYLLGGLNRKRQLTNYDVKSDSFVFYQSGFIPLGNKIFGEAQYWTQIAHNLYILNDFDTRNNKISVYNMADNSFISDFDSIPVTMSDGMGRSCIASSSVYNKIFINGGITNTGIPIKETNILNIETMSWSLASQMQIARRSHSCIIHPHNHILYSIGGSSTTIEKISIVNIHDNKWTYVSGSLSDPTKGLRSFIYGTHIVIIGGLEQSRFTTLYDTIHTIDITTDMVIVSDTKLAFKTAYSATIMVNNIMYAFGGGFGVDDWQSQTISITAAPTKVPTSTDVLIKMPSSVFITSIPTIASTVGIPEITFLHFDNFSSTQLDDKIDGWINIKMGIRFAIALFIYLVSVIACFFLCDKHKKKHNNHGFEKVDGHEINEHNGLGYSDDDCNVNGNLGTDMNITVLQLTGNYNEEKVDMMDDMIHC